MKEKIKTLISNHDKDEEFANLEYPSHQEAFIEFLQTNEINIDEKEISVQTGKLYVDSDGYTGVDGLLFIPSMNLYVAMTAYQHMGWDFYFNGAQESKQKMGASCWHCPNCGYNEAHHDSESANYPYHDTWMNCRCSVCKCEFMVNVTSAKNE